MKAHPPYRLVGLQLAPRCACRSLRLLAPLLLMLGMLAGAEFTSLHAQTPDVQGSDVIIFARQRFQFKIDPKTPLKDLLPLPPKTVRIAESVRGNDLSRIPEVQFEASSALANEEALKRIAHQIAKINHLNDKKTDGFIEALRSERVDLHGLPFAMGDACRSRGERRRQFTRAAALVRDALEPPVVVSLRVSSTSAVPDSSDRDLSTITLTNEPTSQAIAAPVSAARFWEQYHTLRSQEDRGQGRAAREPCPPITSARIAALMQILMPMSEMHAGLVKHLSSVSHVAATRALARLAIFSGDENVRKAALDALRVRRERDYTAILVNGLRYPWPAVARRAAEAIAKLERNDLLPRLIDVLEQADPRAPVMQQVKDKRIPVVRELVRVNHHRSCLLCHAPGNTGKLSVNTIRAEVPVPGQPLTDRWERCRKRKADEVRQEILVRVDVTYLRQDFSVLLAVADAHPWPEMQRFDFLLRRRVLTENEAAAYRDKLKPREPGQFSPYQRAALAALRELTGRDTEPTPQAWRRLLKLPAQ
ncbi:MAG: HEAT repeat domain-containing protein [Gemmataceae bacterium]